MTREEARADLMLAQADISYRPKDDSIDMAIEALENQKSVIEELEKIKAEVEEIRMEEPLMSRAFECYGFKDKTPEDIKTEVIELLDKHISELKGE